ncbi:MAG: malectin [Verrucomicrobiota bacterium]
MNTAKRFALCSSFIPVLAAFLLAGCASNKEQTENTTPAAVAAPVATAAPAEATTTTPAPVTAPESNATPTTIRIDAGSANSYTDSSGNVWLPDQGFADGDTVERDSSKQITNTADPALYRTEHYGMTSFSYTIPNGKYTVILHFAETYDGITGPGQRVFSFNVQGQDFKDFDVWVKAGGPQRAYLETVNVNVTDGKLDITFTPNIENPEINGIEIIPAS